MNSSLLKLREQFVADYTEINISSFLSEIRQNAEVINNSFPKRLLDVCFSLFLFVFVFSWFFPIIALLIKFNSKGSIFFKQIRTGLNNQTIICYKFRSMSVNSRDIDEQGKYIQACENDPRTTRLGKFLRRTSLDELPQFWNVLKGDMSLIGPRPHPYLLDRECEKKVEHYNLRYLVKPGITGWAQVKGYRGGTQKEGQMQKRIDHDFWYINHWNLLLDIKIIGLTMKSIFIGDENAY